MKERDGSEVMCYVSVCYVNVCEGMYVRESRHAMRRRKEKSANVMRLQLL